MLNLSFIVKILIVCSIWFVSSVLREHHTIYHSSIDANNEDVISFGRHGRAVEF